MSVKGQRGWRTLHDSVAKILLIMIFSQVAPAQAKPLKSHDHMCERLAILTTIDPLLAIERETAPAADFKAILGQALSTSSAIREAEARNLEAVAGRNLARAERLSTGHISVSSFRTLSHAFSNDPQNIIERLRARQRTDATIALTQPLIDFGVSGVLRPRARGAGVRRSGTRSDRLRDW